jgi:hypothetical protein
MPATNVIGDGLLPRPGRHSPGFGCGPLGCHGGSDIRQGVGAHGLNQNPPVVILDPDQFVSDIDPQELTDGSRQG